MSKNKSTTYKYLIRLIKTLCVHIRLYTNVVKYVFLSNNSITFLHINILLTYIFLHLDLVTKKSKKKAIYRSDNEKITAAQRYNI